MKPFTKEQAAKAWRVMRGSKVRRAILLGGGAFIGALCPHLPASFAPLCHATADIAHAVARVFVLVGAF